MQNVLAPPAAQFGKEVTAEYFQILLISPQFSKIIPLPVSFPN